MAGLNYQLNEKLHPVLNKLVKHYRALLDLVRKEKDLLVEANLDHLSENNRLKEKVLLEIREIEKERERITLELVVQIGKKGENLTLLEIANYLPYKEGDRLRNYHSVLSLLLKRVQELNTHNESLIQSALQNITGAMKSIKETLGGQKNTYQKKGKLEQGKDQSGRLMSKEV